MPPIGFRGSVEERFWRRVRGGTDETVCWLWEGATNDEGYGQIFIDGRLDYVHRLSFRIHKGPLRDEDIVLHSCDVPACVNPNHLSAGTDQDNSDDKMRKGRDRKARGEDSPSARLSETSVREIDAMLRSGVPHRRIAKLFGVGHTTIAAIAAGRTWSQVTGRS